MSAAHRARGSGRCSRFIADTTSKPCEQPSSPTWDATKPSEPRCDVTRNPVPGCGTPRRPMRFTCSIAHTPNPAPRHRCSSICIRGSARPCPRRRGRISFSRRSNRTTPSAPSPMVRVNLFYLRSLPITPSWMPTARSTPSTRSTGCTRRHWRASTRNCPRSAAMSTSVSPSAHWATRSTATTVPSAPGRTSWPWKTGGSRAFHFRWQWTDPRPTLRLPRAASRPGC